MKNLQNNLGVVVIISLWVALTSCTQEKSSQEPEIIEVPSTETRERHKAHFKRNHSNYCNTITSIGADSSLSTAPGSVIPPIKEPAYESMNQLQLMEYITQPKPLDPEKSSYLGFYKSTAIQTLIRKCPKGEEVKVYELLSTVAVDQSFEWSSTRLEALAKMICWGSELIDSSADLHQDNQSVIKSLLLETLHEVINNPKDLNVSAAIDGYVHLYMNDLLPDSEWIKASKSMENILDSKTPNRIAIKMSPYLYHDALISLKGYLEKGPLESIDACRALTAFPKEISLPILKSALTEVTDFERNFFESAIVDLEAN